MLQAAYAGEKAMEITNREREVLRAWMELQAMGDSRKSKLNDTGNLFRFFAMVRSLIMWMEDLMRQMSTSEKPRDVSGVELLMNNHQGHKAEIDAREDNFGDLYSLGKELLSQNHYASNEIKEKLRELTDKRNGMTWGWEERWEHLQLILEVYQFARDAAVAEAWLIAQDPYLKSDEFGQSIDEVENLIKKHEAFEKAAAAQEERFAALERLTTFELKDMKRRQEEEQRAHADTIERQKAERYSRDTFKGETPVDLINCTAEVATDYTKKKYVFRLRLANGGFYLFQAAVAEQMDLWVNGINAQAQPHEEGSKSQTLPPGSEKKDEPKRRSFFTLKKK